MSITERINKLKPHFLAFNIAENVAYALVKMPISANNPTHKMWKIPDDIYERYKVKCSKDNETENGVYFFSNMEESSNAIDNVFDSIEYTFEFNKALEERGEIFKKLIEQLKELTFTEPLEKLKTLQFVFPEQPKKGKKNGKVPKKIEKDLGKVAEEIKAPEVVGVENKQENNNAFEAAKDLI